MNIQDVYQTLRELGFARSQMEFSRVWLDKSPRYYSSLLARQHQPSVGTLTGLLFRLRNILTHNTDARAKASISSLILALEGQMVNRIVLDGPIRRARARTTID